MFPSEVTELRVLSGSSTKGSHPVSVPLFRLASTVLLPPRALSSGFSCWRVLAVSKHVPHLGPPSAINRETRFTNLLKLVKEKEKRGSKRGCEPNQNFGGIKVFNSILAPPSPKLPPKISFHEGETRKPREAQPLSSQLGTKVT